MNNAIAQYKLKAIQHALGCPDLVAVIAQQETAEPANLVWHKVFPYIRVPDTQEETGRFLLFEVNTPKVEEKNNLLKNMEFSIVMLCHKNAMRTEHGATATDYMAGLVTELFNRNRRFSGGRLKLVSDTASVLVGGIYHYRTLVFTTLEHNGGGCPD